MWQEIVAYYKKHRKHKYRDYKENRHGHSNEKPSFWALGYQTLEIMVDNITEEEWKEYKEIHYDCCGIGKKN